MDSYKGGFIQKIDDSREFTWQELNKHTIKMNETLDAFKTEHIQNYTFDQNLINDKIENLTINLSKIDE